MHYTEESVNWQQRFVLARAYTHTQQHGPFRRDIPGERREQREGRRETGHVHHCNCVAHTHTCSSSGDLPRRERIDAHYTPWQRRSRRESRLYKLAAARGSSLAAPAEDVQRERSVGQLLEEVPGLGARHQAHGLSVDGDQFVAHQQPTVPLGGATSKDPLDD